MRNAAARDALGLALILILAFALRLPALNGPLWYDEITTVETHLKLGWGEALQSYSMNHHYLHNFAAKVTMDMFGGQPWAIRLPALIFGLASIWAMWVLVRRTAGSAMAHATGALMALSYHHIWFSTNARGYTGMALFSTLGLMFFLQGLDRPRKATWVWFAAMLVATAFTHLTGIFFFATLGLIWLGTLARDARRGGLTRERTLWPLAAFAGGLLVTGLLYLPILPSLLETVGNVSDTSAIDPMQEYQSPLWAAAEAIRTGLGEAGPVMLVVGALVVILSVLGALTLQGTAGLIGLVTFGHILLTLAVLMAVGMRVWPRFFFPDIAFLLFLILLGVRLVCGWIARLVPTALGRLAFPVALGLMLLLSGVLATRNYTMPKQDLAGAVAFVERVRQPGDRVFATLYAGEIFTGHFGMDWGTVWTDQDYAKALAQPGPVLFVVAFPGRSMRSLPALDADEKAGRLTELIWLPGSLGDGGVQILRRN